MYSSCVALLQCEALGLASSFAPPGPHDGNLDRRDVHWKTIERYSSREKRVRMQDDGMCERSQFGRVHHLHKWNTLQSSFRLRCHFPSPSNILMSIEDDIIETLHTWTLYSHFLSDSDNYQASYVKMCHVSSFQDFGRMWNHTHPKLVGDQSRIMQIHGRRVTSWSFFKDGISPEWEHPSNKNGLTFSLRCTMSCDDVYTLWETLVTDCVLSKCPSHLNGIQVSRKSGSVRPREPGLLMKFDLWFSSEASQVHVSHWLRHTLPDHDFLHVSRSKR